MSRPKGDRSPIEVRSWICMEDGSLVPFDPGLLTWRPGTGPSLPDEVATGSKAVAARNAAPAGVCPTCGRGGE